jgi:hypothetical protein
MAWVIGSDLCCRFCGSLGSSWSHGSVLFPIGHWLSVWHYEDIMTYAIATIIYGIPLDTYDADVTISEELSNLIEDQEGGFICLYRGNSDGPGQAFGIEVSEFDECNHHIDIKDLTFQPSLEQVKKLSDLLDALPNHIVDEMAKTFGPARTFLLWSSS